MTTVTGVGAAPAWAYTDGSYGDVYYVNSCDTSASINSAPAFTGATFGGMQVPEECTSLGGMQITAPGGVVGGASANWSAITPIPSMAIVGVNASGVADCNLHSDGFSADYFYGNNGVNYGAPAITIDCHGASGNGTAGVLNGFIQPSRYFGFQASCGQSTCYSTGANSLVFSATGITLAVQETTGPSLSPTGDSNLYDQSGFVRGTFDAGVSASDPSGVCAMQTTVNGSTVSSYADPTRDTSQWSQCSGSQLDSTIDTTSLADGANALTLSYTATNAAGASSAISRTVGVDNMTPSIVLTGPTDAVSTAGTQYVTATGSAGPSGIAAVYCSVDGGAVKTYPGSVAEVPVAGLGGHQVACYARNRAVDANGVTASSPVATFDLSIRQPTAAAITFAHIADALRCRSVTEMVTLPGRRHTVRRHGKRVRVRGPKRHVRRRVRRCHARTVIRTVSVVLKRHGRPVLRHGQPVRVKRRERFVVLPHTVNQPTRRIGHGKRTTVSGFVELANGTALAGQPVEVVSAPNDNAVRFRLMRTVTTNADGIWTATVPAGPSRLIEAIYPGNGTTEPALSSTVTLTVPARIALSISPRVLPWAGKITIRGRLVGGYVPGDGVALRLRVPYPGGQILQEPFRTNRHGQFRFRWTYHAGRGVITYRFAVATTAAESDYPWAAAMSRGVPVTFGPPTPHTRRRHRHRHRARPRGRRQ